MNDTPPPRNGSRNGRSPQTARPGQRAAHPNAAARSGPGHTRPPNQRVQQNSADVADDRKGSGKPPRQRSPRPRGVQPKSGLLSRYMALTILESVIRDQSSLDIAIPEAMDDDRFADLAPRDKAFARLLAMTVLRRHKSLQRVVDHFLQKPLAANAERIRIILLAGAAELTLLEVPPHAAISTAVELTRLSAKTLHFDKLANAILRRISESGQKLLQEQGNDQENFPEWMLAGWAAAYGSEAAAQIAAASLSEAALDLTPKSDPIEWSARLDAIILPTGSLRRATGGRIEDLDGYAEGGWWVQDAAAALPARLLAPKPGSRVLDICAAPGGKTAQLCATGADVTALDVSDTRLQRLRENLDRLGFDAISIASNAATWRSPEPFDHVLIDAPCTATGTIRRHPDILHLKREGDTARLAELQLSLLQNAATLVKVGGTIVYCTCSLEPAEGEVQIEAFLADQGSSHARLARQPITPTEIGNQTAWITASGDLRTLPFYLPHENPALAGIDGFYAARLVRVS